MIERLPLIALLAGCAVLAGVLVAEIAAPSEREPELASAPPTPVAPAVPAGRTEASALYDSMVATILARPLFDASRRPPLRGNSSPADDSLDDARLAGIVTWPGHRFAIFAPTGAKPMVVTEGGTIGGWRVDSITPSEVSLSGPGGTKTLQPKNDPNLTPSTTSAATPPFTQPNLAVQPPGRPGLPAALLGRAGMRPGRFRERR